ncbi:serine O-acetyltransferase [uncultured Phocaeicola sp.]|uniref:serine O-acetyltransferase n=1 Tax=uncultured Phocaeicola sp. TaxID=990718 RepID=UPI00143401B7|nr:serine acetyltransferase [uncultured Phocaeicola sp.]GFH97778.1 serine acetyltransferase [Bacteroidaceae bacterium]
MNGNIFLKFSLPFFTLFYFPLLVCYLLSKKREIINTDVNRWAKHQPFYYRGVKNSFVRLIIAIILKPEFRKQLIWRLGGYKYIIFNFLYGKSNTLYIERSTVIGQGFMVIHGNGTVIGGGSIIGNNFTIYQNATIGYNNGFPTIGNNVFIGAGAVVIGKIRIGNNVKIGAGAVVIEDVPDNCTVVGPKAKVILREL